MTNFEKYKNDLMKIEGSFAFDKEQQKIVGCRDSAHGIEECIDCEDCLFNNTQYCFESDKLKWLYSEYKEPVLSNDELELIKVIEKVTNKKYKYIIRIESDGIRLFVDKPTVLEDDFGRYCSSKRYVSVLDSENILFQNLRYEDGIYDIENKTFIK